MRRHTHGWVLLAGAAVSAAVLARRPAAGLRGRVVLITGGSRGLGLLLAREFGREGCRVAICARDAVELDRARSDLEARGVEVLATPCDVARRAEVERWVAGVEQAFGAIDVLVNNAGVIQVGPVGAMTLEDFEHAMDVNFWGAVHVTFASLPRMRRGARIVNVTSIGGKVAIPHLLPYGCAKFALVGFSEGLRAELAGEGIRVTTIVPGLMRTGSPVNALFKGQQEKEFTWFSLGDAAPLTAMAGQRAARRIVLAARRGEAEVTLTWQAKLLRLTHGLFPGATAELLGWINRILPGAVGSTEAARGMELATPLSPSPLTAPMNRAARENNEYGGHHEPSPEHAARVGLTQP